MVIILMGVAGAGKTTVGKLLAQGLGSSFFDADDYHSSDNVRHMRAGLPLGDEQREPWLALLEALVASILAQDEQAVLACSALRAGYRERLGRPDATGRRVRFVYLEIGPEEAQRRVTEREGHFMPTALVETQFAALEQPAGVVVVDATRPPEELVRQIRTALSI